MKISENKLQKNSVSLILTEIGKRLLNNNVFWEYKDKPVEFVKEIIGADPDIDQAEILQALSDFPKIGWRSGHGVGKTTTASWAAIWFLFTRQYSKVITTASVWRQVEKMLWSEIAKWVRRCESKLKTRVKYEILKTVIDIGPDWFATGESSDKPEKMEGFHAEHILYIVDEGKAVPKTTYEAIEGALTTKEAKELVISTPGEKAGYFYEIFSKKIPGFKTFHTSGEDSPRVSKDWIEEKKLQWGENSPIYQAKVKGDFPDISEDILIHLGLIEIALVKEIDVLEPLELGIDVARFGSDKTVFIIRQGGRVLKIIKTVKEDTMQTVGRAAVLIREWNFDLVKVDVIGIGAGVFDKLHEDFGDIIVEVNVAAKSDDSEKFANLRAEIFWGLRQRFLDGDISLIDVNDDELIGELSNIKYKYNSRGQLLIESKEDMKKRGLPSPNCADSLALCFYSKNKILPVGSNVQAMEDWYKEDTF